MRSKSIPVAAMMTGLMVLSAFAQSQKIAYVDMQAALLATKDGKKALDEINVKFGPRRDLFAKHKQELADKQTSYQKQAATMSDDAKVAADREVQLLSRDLQREADDNNTDLQAEEARLMGGVLQKMEGILNKYAVDHQISMVVDSSQQPNNLIYADKSVNITPEVVALYDTAPAPAPAPAAASAPKPAAAPAAPRKPAPAPAPAAK